MEEKTNGDRVYRNNLTRGDETETLQDTLRRLVSTIAYPDSSTPLLQRIKISVSQNGPRIGEVSRDTGRTVLRWARDGSPLRALLVISVGTITFLSLTGLLVFMLFVLAASVNAIIVSFLIALATAGGFLAIFFACVTVTYIGALSVAAFVISTATILAVIAALVATGWVGFFWVLWLCSKKSVDLAKHSFTMTGSALSAYTSTRQESDEGSD